MGTLSPGPRGTGRAHARPDDDNLEVRLWLRLLACSSLIEGTVRRRLRESFQTTLPRFDLLAQLDRVPDGMTMGELSRRLMVSNGNITGLVDRLVAAGLVERVPHAVDRRTVLVRLTPAGKDKFDAMVPAHAQWIEQLFGALDRTDMRHLCQLLDGVKQSASRGDARDMTGQRDG